jgi:hypothetical protein
LIHGLLFHGACYGLGLTNPDLPKREGWKIPVWDAGKLRLHAAMKTEEQLDTNIFLTDQKEKFDSVTLICPSAGIEIPFQRHIFSADYEMKANIFSNYTDQRLRGLADMQFNSVDVKIREDFMLFNDRSGSEDTNRIKRMTNVLGARVVASPAHFDKLNFEFGYDNTIEHFLNDDLIFDDMTYKDKDRMINDFICIAAYRIFPKTSLLLECDFGFYNYDHPQVSDSAYLQPRIGVKGKITEKISSTLKAGFRYQDYDGNGSVVIGKDYIGPVASGALTYLMTERDLFELAVERAIYESTYDNINYYDTNMVGLRYDRKFNDKLTGTILGKYQINLYPNQTTENGVTAKRYDNFYTFGAALRYDFNKWSSARVGFDHVERHSRFSNFNYRDNLVTMRGTIGF